MLKFLSVVVVVVVVKVGLGNEISWRIGLFTNTS